jgi:hypothetical protein
MGSPRKSSLSNSANHKSLGENNAIKQLRSRLVGRLFVRVRAKLSDLFRYVKYFFVTAKWKAAEVKKDANEADCDAAYSSTISALLCLRNGGIASKRVAQAQFKRRAEKYGTSRS